MTQSTFMQRCRDEWQRLNPNYVSEAEGVFPTLQAAFREALPGYFAPLRFLWWLVVHSWRRG